MNNYQELHNNYEKWYLNLQEEDLFQEERKKFLSLHSKVFTRVQIEPTQRCNFSCHMCPIDEIQADTKEDLSLIDYILLLDQLPSTVKYITLSGLGEPFLNPNYIQMAKIAYERGYLVEVYNNGSKFDENILPYIYELFFSLDAVDETILRNVRKGINKDLVIKNIKNAIEYRDKHKDKNLKVNINFCIHSQNQLEIKHILPLCQELKINHLHIQTVSNNYATDSKAYNSFTSYVQQSHQIEWVKIIKLYKREYDFLFTIWYPRKLKGFCNWTFSSLYINKNMDVISCCQKVTNPMIFGNIKETKLSDIYYSEQMSSFRDAHIKGDYIELCEKCPF